MRRLMTFTVAWLFAAVAATTAAWQGVSLVTDEVTENRPAALAASDVQEQLAEGASDAPGAGSTTTTTPATTTTTGAPASTTTTTPDAVAPVSRTYRLEGGTVRIAFSPTGVRATSVVPNQGFGVDKNGPEDGGWRVELESEGHRSRIDAWWDGGPQFRTREDPR